MKHPICKTGDVPPEGEARVFPFFGREVQVWRVGARIRAAANVCLHLGGPLECKDGAFVCPWHGARFDMTNGQKLDGPAPASARLMFLPTRIEGEELLYVWGETP
jgi:nitrite reductase/ring-hydroxylating ferredoxin subunit|tara:strand:+ start:3588 stop:3902 length:315 start_codon:yes stop_codon:yes gene_type:complete